MKKSKKSIVLTVLIVSLLQAVLSAACSCMVPPPPKESLEQATVVFAGKITQIDTSHGMPSSMNPVKVTFEISKVWKGPDQPTLTLMTMGDGANCGFIFNENEEYLVYAEGEPNDLSASLCSRTTTLAAANEDLKELGEGRSPEQTPVETPEIPRIPPKSTNSESPPQTTFWPWILGIGVVLVLVLTLFLKPKKKR